MTVKSVLKKNRHVYKYLYLALDRLSYVVPRKAYLKQQWRKHNGTDPNLDNPNTFNEKIYWELLNSDNLLARKCSDKLAVRDYVRDRIGSEYLNSLYGIYGGMNDVDLSCLPDSFVLKNTHDSSSVLLVPDRDLMDYKYLVDMDIRLSLNYGKTKRQWVYDKIEPHLIAERNLSSDDGQPPWDYKVFCFNGVAKFVQVDTGRFSNHQQSSYDREWHRLTISWRHARAALRNIEKPSRLSQMLAVSEALAMPFNHVRVDWYIYRNTLIFGEMTFFHLGGLGHLDQAQWDLQLGSWFQVSRSLSY